MANNGTFLGFTGTPIESRDVNTPAVFGHYVDVYDINMAVTDGATVRIYYESRLAKILLTQKGRQLVEDLDAELSAEPLSESQKAKAKWTQLEALIGSSDRLNKVAADITAHFGKRQEVFPGKGMIVAMSRRIAVDLYHQLIQLNPQWHHDHLKKGALKVVITAASDDGPELARHHTTKQQRRMLSRRMKDTRDPLQLVIVVDMWLTGFDVPAMHTLYIDKPMRGHNLMQAIARVNRVYLDKPGGLVVDYLGIASDLKEALSFYSESGGKGDPAHAQEQAVKLMLEKLEILEQLFTGYPYDHYYDAPPIDKLTILQGAANHVLQLEEGLKRFNHNVAALSGAYALAVNHPRADDEKDEIAFFQAIKSILVKFTGAGTGRSDVEIETAIRQVIDAAIVSESVVDIFDAAGIKKPDISILSEEFMDEVKVMKHKNVALEVLRKLLNDEIRSRTAISVIHGRSLLEMLEDSIKKYHNKVLTAAQVIDELIDLGKEVKKMVDAPGEMGISEYEYAFYTAIADNQSAVDVLGNEKLKELAVLLYAEVKKKATIDWTIKENVRAALRVTVKRTLRRYGYPPDLEDAATQTVIKQMEVIANYQSNRRCP